MYLCYRSFLCHATAINRQFFAEKQAKLNQRIIPGLFLPVQKTFFIITLLQGKLS